jgi:type III restriction enzyme
MPRNIAASPLPLDFGQQSLPIQPVDRPILCSPYVEPHEHWAYTNGEPFKVPGRRPASYFYKNRGAQPVGGLFRQTTSSAGRGSTGDIFAEEVREELPFVNALRQDVSRWRASGYEGATNITKELLRHWTSPDRPRRLFFCQIEAVETIIFLIDHRTHLICGIARWFEAAA